MDFYIVLGVERSAPAGEIKRAYKRLARRLHPDINPGDREAAARFRQVLDAYETLMDPDRRRRYDAGQMGASPSPDDDASFGFAGFDFSSRVYAERTTTFGELFEEVLSKRAPKQYEGAEHGADIHARTTLTFEEAWHGVQQTVTVTRQDVCRTCAGGGFQRVAETRCVSCEGTGAVRSVRGHMVFAKTCPTCGGEGRLKQEECAPCHGQGVAAAVGNVDRAHSAVGGGRGARAHSRERPRRRPRRGGRRSADRRDAWPSTRSTVAKATNCT